MPPLKVSEALEPAYKAFGKAKIADAGNAILIKKDISRLEVAVDDPVFVNDFQPLRI